MYHNQSNTSSETIENKYYSKHQLKSFLYQDRKKIKESIKTKNIVKNIEPFFIKNNNINPTEYLLQKEIKKINHQLFIIFNKNYKTISEMQNYAKKQGGQFLEIFTLLNEKRSQLFAMLHILYKDKYIKTDDITQIIHIEATSNIYRKNLDKKIDSILKEIK